MKSITLSFGLLATTAMAFPAAVLDEAQNSPELAKRMEDLMNMFDKRQQGADAAQNVFEAIPSFDEKTQFVDVGPNSGHEWQAPGPTDLRGPCPGLNAFANHGFLPRNGYATITQFIDATTNVVGMGADLAAFLAVFGAEIDGSGTAWSIGGTPSPSQSGLAPFGGGNGISASHNKYESDASPTRPDLYQYGNDYKTRPQQYAELIKMSPGGYVTLDSLVAFRSKRFDEQIAMNPYFFNGPFTGVLVQPAAYSFIYRFMANHSAEAPLGKLSYDVLGSWFAVTGSQSKGYKATQGYERIPTDWYKRSPKAPYTIQYLNLETLTAAKLHPKFLDVGGNLGKKNSFTGVNLDDLSGGIYNSQNLFKGNNAACLAYQFAAQEKPDVALAALDKLTSTIGGITSKLSCPKLQKFDQNQLNQFPGYVCSQKGQTTCKA